MIRVAVSRRLARRQVGMERLLDVFDIVHTLSLPGRAGELRTLDGLALRPETRNMLRHAAPAGIFGHQHEAIAAVLRGEDVVVATSTASGKSLVFQAAGVEALAAHPHARVLAVYPMKALGREQETRWRRALEVAGTTGNVVRIDGSVPSAMRNGLLSRARVVIATPDILHAWLLPRAGLPGNEAVTRFLSKLSLVVLDEAHAYTGVFGSNSAFMYRRLQHAAALSGAKPRFVAASATLRDPALHLERLTGRSFTVIGRDRDTSPRHPVELVMVRPREGADHHTALGAIFHELRRAGERFIAFFDSRRSTELMASIVQRDDDPTEGFSHLFDGSILPFKAGYEAEHRDVIQERLGNGSLAGVLSTSALELGLDIPGLHTAVLVGVPASITSFHQRIGRVGRSGPGRVILVHGGSLGDDVAFESPEALLDRPLAESAIYLENRRIQYIHAMALAREHDALSQGRRDVASTGVPWPERFTELVEDERQGRVPLELRDMKRDAGDAPTQQYPLRDVESQFRVWLGRGRDRSPLGSLSYGQVMREAFPGAVYYYLGRPHRVLFVDARTREVIVRPESFYSTSAAPILSRITPQRTVHDLYRHGDLLVGDVDLQTWIGVKGFRQHRGPLTEAVTYPCTSPVTYNQPFFARTLFTSGIVLAHPALDVPGVDADALARLLLESFLLVVPVERQDVDAACDTLRGQWHDVAAGRRILVLYDQTYGSLHLTARLLEDRVLERVLQLVVLQLEQREDLEIAGDVRPIDEATRDAAHAILEAVRLEPTRESGTVHLGEMTSQVRVMLPRSHAVSPDRPGEVLEIHQVFVRPDLGLCYRGVWLAADGSRQPAVVPVRDVGPAPGAMVVWGTYDLDTGEQQIAA